MKYNKKTLSIAGVFLFFSLCLSPVHASLVYDWYIYNPVQTVGPNDIVQINGTISNDATSTVNFDLDAAITLAVVSSFPSAYNAVFGPGSVNILSQFNGIVLTPGDSFDFVFATLTPGPAPVAAGDYYVTTLGLGINGVTDYWKAPNPYYDVCAPYCQEFNNGYVKITVSGGETNGEPSSVPEPTTLALMSPGLIALGFYRRKSL